MSQINKVGLALLIAGFSFSLNDDRLICLKVAAVALGGLMFLLPVERAG